MPARPEKLLLACLRFRRSSFDRDIASCCLKTQTAAKRKKSKRRIFVLMPAGSVKRRPDPTHHFVP